MSKSRGPLWNKAVLYVLILSIVQPTSASSKGKNYHSKRMFSEYPFFSADICELKRWNVLLRKAGAPEMALDQSGEGGHSAAVTWSISRNWKSRKTVERDWTWLSPFDPLPRGRLGTSLCQGSQWCEGGACTPSALVRLERISDSLKERNAWFVWGLLFDIKGLNEGRLLVVLEIFRRKNSSSAGSEKSIRCREILRKAHDRYIKGQNNCTWQSLDWTQKRGWFTVGKTSSR